MDAAILLPVFCLIAIGHGIAPLGVLSERASSGLEEFAQLGSTQ
ncbi:hypothetical protein [Microvirga massiliensis]|nr:hypothetical protein [Microvirga massiliensis]